MHFDNEDQRQIFFQLVEQAQWPGKVIEKIIQLKQEIIAATVGEKAEK